MALRYSYGKYGWGLDPRGIFRTPQELGWWFKMNEKGYDQLHFGNYETNASKLYPDWASGSLETKVKYSIDPFGNYYMDPNGKYNHTNVFDIKGNSIRNVHVPHLDEFRNLKISHK